MWISLAALVGLGALWVACSRVSLTLVLPVFFIANAIPAPWASNIEVYPDFGLGGIAREVPTVGDSLLLATAALHPQVREQLGRVNAASFLVFVSLVASLLALLRADVPLATGAYLALVPMRLGLALAVMRVGLGQDRSPRHALVSVMAALSMLWGAAALMVTAKVTGLIGIFPFSELVTGDDRLSFPTLGNNKIGLTLLVLTAAVGLLASRLDHRLASAVFPSAVFLSLVTSTVAQLRFTTTALALVLLAWVVTHPRLRAPGLLVGAAVAIAAVRMENPLSEVRALSVLTGDFDFATDSSLNSRSELWRAAFVIWRENPVFGRVGEWEYARPVDHIVFLGPLETHSEVMWTLATFGGLGLLAMVVAVLPVLRVCGRVLLVPGRGTLAAPSTCAALALVSLLLNVATFFPASAWALATLSATASWWLEPSAPPEPSGGRARLRRRVFPAPPFWPTRDKVAVTPGARRERGAVGEL